jgi:hypothetical protein
MEVGDFGLVNRTWRITCWAPIWVIAGTTNKTEPYVSLHEIHFISQADCWTMATIDQVIAALVSSIVGCNVSFQIIT